MRKRKHDKYELITSQKSEGNTQRQVVGYCNNKTLRERSLLGRAIGTEQENSENFAQTQVAIDKMLASKE